LVIALRMTSVNSIPEACAHAGISG